MSSFANCARRGAMVGIVCYALGLFCYHRHYTPGFLSAAFFGALIACTSQAAELYVAPTIRLLLIPLPIALFHANVCRPVYAPYPPEIRMFADVLLLTFASILAAQFVGSERSFIRAIAGYLFAFGLVRFWLFQLNNDYSGAPPEQARSYYAAVMAILTTAALAPRRREPDGISRSTDPDL